MCSSSRTRSRSSPCPPLADAIVFFGAGFDVLRLGRVPWLRERDVVYWGDIDTHGFVILDRLRGQLPNVRSTLMDLDTLTAHAEPVDDRSQPVTCRPHAAHG